MKNKRFFNIIKGPAASLFQESYYDLLKNALRPNGIVCCQGKTILLFMYSELVFYTYVALDIILKLNILE